MMSQKNNFVQSFRYPWIVLVRRNAIIIFLFLVARYHVNSQLGRLDALLVIIWLVLVYIFGIQYTYVKINIYRDQLKVNFPLSLYLNERIYPFSEVSAFIFVYDVATRSDPFMKIEFKNGKKKKIIIPLTTIVQIHNTLKKVYPNTKAIK